MSSDLSLAKLLEKLNSRLLVQEEHGFQKRAITCPLAMGAPKSVAFIGLKGNYPELLLYLVLSVQCFFVLVSRPGTDSMKI